MQTIDLMRSGDMTATEQEVVLDGFYRQVSLVTVMVNNLLVWANSQQYGIKSEIITLNITATVNGIISISNYLAKNKKINLVHHYNRDKWVAADLDHVKIIIQNLVGNAIKFTPQGGIVQIFYSEDDVYFAVHVKDSGVGIPPEKMAKLFKVIGKEISGYGTNNEAGAGIGLMLIKQFVDANDGKLEIQSRLGQGSEFTVYFRKVAKS
jgi:signal transduction histidine kinase